MKRPHGAFQGEHGDFSENIEIVAYVKILCSYTVGKIITRRSL
jgi:hypothetical protein